MQSPTFLHTKNTIIFIIIRQDLLRQDLWADDVVRILLFKIYGGFYGGESTLSGHRLTWWFYMIFLMVVLYEIWVPIPKMPSVLMPIVLEISHGLFSEWYKQLPCEEAFAFLLPFLESALPIYPGTHLT